MTTKRLIGAIRIALLALGVSVAPHSAIAQETINYASVSGRVTDPSGAVIPGAQVTARHSETNLTATAATDGEGRFRFPYLKVGPYEITVRQTGFADATRRLTLTVGAAFELPVALAIGTVDAGVTVTADAIVLEAARSQIAGTVSQTEVRNLPMNGRNFLDLALLIPGVSPPNLGSTQLFAETSAVAGAGVSIGSQRNFSNNFIVDGLSASDDAAGLIGMPYGVDAVDQFQVVTSGGQAELGRALGGYVNVLTKSGTNAVHGDVYDYARDGRFNAPNALSGTTLPMSQAQYGVSLGGPVVRDRTFYFCHGFQLSSTLQSYSALPLNITSGVTTVQATAGRPLVNGAFIRRNIADGPDFFSVSVRVSRAFAVRRSVRVEGLIEAFNLTNRLNNVAVNANFGAGAYPANPSATFGQVTAVGDPRSVQFGLRFRF